MRRGLVAGIWMVAALGAPVDAAPRYDDTYRGYLVGERWEEFCARLRREPPQAAVRYRFADGEVRYQLAPGPTDLATRSIRLEMRPRSFPVARRLAVQLLEPAHAAVVRTEPRRAPDRYTYHRVRGGEAVTMILHHAPGMVRRVDLTLVPAAR